MRRGRDELTDRLVARSLVIAEDLGFQTRYRVLETIRQYGEERLAELDETAELRRRHGEYFVEFQRQIAPDLQGPSQIDAARRLSAETENLLAAFALAVDTNNADLALRLVAAYPPEGWNLGRAFRYPIEAALTMPGAAQHPDYPYALATAAFYAAFGGDSELRHETIARLDATLSRDRQLELRAEGQAMDPDQAVTYTLTHLDLYLTRTADS